MIDDVDALAVRDYTVTMPDGSAAVLSFAVCDPGDGRSIPARFARAQKADAYGLIAISGVASAPATPLLWVLVGETVAITVGDGDPDLTADLRTAIIRQMPVYFADVTDLDLACVGISLKPRTLH
jgi:hypothetical protein